MHNDKFALFTLVSLFLFKLISKRMTVFGNLSPKEDFWMCFRGLCLLLTEYVALFRYKKDKKVLLVNINKCMDLTSKDKNVGTSDPYVKLQLLPDKEHKVKTRVLRKTRNPVYDEDFTFFGIQTNKLQVWTKTTTMITRVNVKTKKNNYVFFVFFSP